MTNSEPASTVHDALLALPWILGGLSPTRRDFAWSILLAFAAGLLSIVAIVMSAFDVARPTDTAEPGEGESPS